MEGKERTRLMEASELLLVLLTRKQINIYTDSEEILLLRLQLVLSFAFVVQETRRIRVTESRAFVRNELSHAPCWEPPLTTGLPTSASPCCCAMSNGHDDDEYARVTTHGEATEARPLLSTPSTHAILFSEFWCPSVEIRTRLRRKEKQKTSKYHTLKGVHHRRR